MFEMRLVLMPAVTKLLLALIQNEFVRFRVCCRICSMYVVVVWEATFYTVSRFQICLLS